MMTVTTWPAERLEKARLRCKEIGLKQTAAELGVTDSSLRSAFAHNRISDWRPDPAPASAGVSVSGEGLGREEEEGPVVLDWSGARPRVSSGEGVERRLVLADFHIPYHDIRACTGALALARATQPHRVILLGDFINNGAVSHHPRPYGGRERHAPAIVMGASFLQALRKAVPGAEIHFLAGNHDDWALEYEDEHPEFRGLFAAEHYFGFKKLGIVYVPREKQPLILGPSGYRHGTGGGEHFCKRYAERDAVLYGVQCMVVGHHHAFQHYMARNGCEAWGVACLANWRMEAGHAFDYARKAGEPGHWQPGALMEDVLGEYATRTPVMLKGGRAFYGGRLIAAA